MILLISAEPSANFSFPVSWAGGIIPIWQALNKAYAKLEPDLCLRASLPFSIDRFDIRFNESGNSGEGRALLSFTWLVKGMEPQFVMQLQGLVKDTSWSRTWCLQEDSNGFWIFVSKKPQTFFPNIHLEFNTFSGCVSNVEGMGASERKQLQLLCFNLLLMPSPSSLKSPPADETCGFSIFQQESVTLPPAVETTGDVGWLTGTSFLVKQGFPGKSSWIA